MVSNIKVDLIKLIEKLDLPQEQKKRLLPVLKDPKTVIPKEQRKEISVLITLLICGNNPDKVMTDYNKKLIEEYSEQYLQSNKNIKSPTPKSKK